MQQLIEKAEVLTEALPYIQRFRDKTFVIKYGGAAMADPKLCDAFAVDVVLLRAIGLRPVVVHGGGKRIAQALQARGITSRFEGGLRVTNDAAMEVVEAVLGGAINREIITRIHQNGGRAAGLSGADGRLLQVQARAGLGRVGEIKVVAPEALHAVSNAGFIPVVAPIGVDADDITHNINADEAAGALAAALNAEKLILLTDVAGVQNAAGELIPQLTRAEAQQLLAGDAIQGGMIPKLHCCLAALKAGCGSAHIIDGRVRRALLLEIFTNRGIGTLLKKN